MTDDERIAELLIQWEDSLDQGREVSAAELCKYSPHLVEELSRRIQALRGTAWMDQPVDGNGNDSPLADSAAPDTPPRTLANRYRLHQKIAEGGFAQVWKGEDVELLRTVAVKMPKASHIGPVDSFMAEARRVARLKHPGIVPVHDVGKDGDDFFIVAEFVEGGSLGDRLKKEPITPEQSCRWLAEIADALNYAHEKGIIHRDIKPANILLDHHGRALLADFGIALSANKTGQFAPSLGTLAYMSPEQLEGKPLDPRSDVYSLGVLLCQLLTGKLPYDAHDTNSLRKEIVSGAIRLSVSGQALTPELRSICLKCLAYDPNERYSTSKDLANDLRSLQSRPAKRNSWWLIPLLGLLIVPTGFGIRHLVQDKTANKTNPAPIAAINESMRSVKDTIAGINDQVASLDRESKKESAAALARANQLFDKKDYQAAISEYALAIDSGSRDAEPYHRRAVCRFNLKQYQDSANDFVMAIQLDKSDPLIRKHYSLALSQMGLWDDAIRELEEALEMTPADPNEYHDLLARNYSNRAKERADEGRWDRALPDLTAAIKHDPKPSMYFRQRGAAYFNLNQLELAVADFTAAIEREPKESSFYEFRGKALKVLGKQAEADADLEKAKQLSP